jgi:hypothetical protein
MCFPTRMHMYVLSLDSGIGLCARAYVNTYDAYPAYMCTCVCTHTCSTYMHICARAYAHTHVAHTCTYVHVRMHTHMYSYFLREYICKCVCTHSCIRMLCIRMLCALTPTHVHSHTIAHTHSLQANQKDKYHKICLKKQNTPINDLCKGLPAEFGSLFFVLFLQN